MTGIGERWTEIDRERRTGIGVGKRMTWIWKRRAVIGRERQ